MKVVVPTNCAKKKSVTEMKKEMAKIGHSAFIAKTPKTPIEAVRSELCLGLKTAKRHSH